MRTPPAQHEVNIAESASANISTMKTSMNIPHPLQIQEMITTNVEADVGGPKVANVGSTSVISNITLSPMVAPSSSTATPEETTAAQVLVALTKERQEQQEQQTPMNVDVSESDDQLAIVVPQPKRQKQEAPGRTSTTQELANMQESERYDSTMAKKISCIQLE